MVMDETDDLIAIAYIQSAIIEMRRTAAETDNPRTRDACLYAADNIEKCVRELDRIKLGPC
jgi:hypothetical protein